MFEGDRHTQPDGWVRDDRIFLSFMVMYEMRVDCHVAMLLAMTKCWLLFKNFKFQFAVLHCFGVRNVTKNFYFYLLLSPVKSAIMEQIIG